MRKEDDETKHDALRDRVGHVGLSGEGAVDFSLARWIVSIWAPMTTTFDLDLSDVDRGVYETLSFTVTAQASETAGYLIARVLAYALEYGDGLTFSRGLCAGEEPALWVHDLTGRLTAWIEVGLPDAARLHKAAKAAARVVVYAHKDPTVWLRHLAAAKVHRAEHIGIVELDRGLLAALEASLDRRNRWAVSVSDDVLYVDVAGRSLSAPLVRLPWPDART